MLTGTSVNIARSRKFLGSKLSDCRAQELQTCAMAHRGSDATRLAFKAQRLCMTVASFAMRLDVGLKVKDIMWNHLLPGLSG